MPDGKPTAKVGTIVKEDPVLRFSKAKGTPFVSFSLKVHPWVPGEERPEPIFYKVTAFKGTAEHVAECLKKGDRVGVIGKGHVDSREYSGKTYTDNVIIADFVGADLTFCGVDVHRGERVQPKSAPLNDEIF